MSEPKAAAALRGNQPGVVDLYFVGFAGTADQDVFLKEVRSVTELFDRRIREYPNPAMAPPDDR